jgi:uncharacterized membrane protein
MEQTKMPQASDPFHRAATTLADVHAEGLDRARGDQLGIERLIRTIGRPLLVYVVIVFVGVWIVVDALVAHFTHRAFDAPQLPWLQGLLTLWSLMMTALVLVAENRQGEIADKRAQVTLQFALVTEQKIAKVIELLETMRRDDPSLPNRRDDQADSMAKATDIRVAVDHLEQAKEDAIRERNLAPL